MNKNLLDGILITAAFVAGYIAFDWITRRKKMSPAEVLAEQQEWFEINEPLGKSLGYPACCIKEFCDQPPEVLKQGGTNEDDNLRYKAGCIDGEFTGFIPCVTHAKQIIAGEITLGSLIKNRSAEFGAFPEHAKY